MGVGEKVGVSDYKLRKSQISQGILNRVLDMNPVLYTLK